MLKIKLFTLTAMLLCMHVLHTYAQGEGNIWYFGHHAGMDFNGGAPVPLVNGAMSTQEGCASIADSYGNLLFYTDGLSVWDATHSVMPGGTGLAGHPSSTQSATIIPKPNFPGIYYIFTVSATFGMLPHYSEVDMTLNGGLGDVTILNVPLASGGVEKLTTVKHSNDVDYWVVTNSGPTLYSYLVTSAGVSPMPVANNIPGMGGGFPTGQMKIAANGTKLAHARGANTTLLDFDATTGVFSNPIDIPSLLYNGGVAIIYGVEFSLSGDYLYMNSPLNPTLGGLFQVNTTLGSAAAIIASQMLIGTSSPSSGFSAQMAPDGKIYLTGSGSTLSVVNNPNLGGVSCNFQPNSFNLGGQNGFMGLPTFVQSFFLLPQLYVQDTCHADTALFYMTNARDSVVWNFGDSASGLANTAIGDSVYHHFSAPGQYQVTTVDYFIAGNGFLDSLLDTIVVNIHPAPEFWLGPDTTICQGDTLWLDTIYTFNSATYLWSDGSTNEFLPILVADTYSLEISALCGEGYDTIVIDSIIAGIVDLGPDTSFCIGDTVDLEVFVEQGSYIWHDGDSGAVHSAHTAGLYSVTATGFCGESRDSVKVDFVSPPTFQFSNDTTYCDGQQLNLVVQADSSATFLWNDGSVDSLLTPSTSDTFRVTVTNACGVFEDSVVVFVDFPLSVQLGPDTVLCQSVSYALSPTLQGVNTFFWNNGSTADSLLISNNGLYSVSVTNTCGTYDDTIQIEYEVPPTVELPEQVVLCTGEELKLSAEFSRSTYQWSNGSQSAEIDALLSGNYVVTVTNLCGVAVDSTLLLHDFPLEVVLEETHRFCHGKSVTLNASSPNEPLYEWNDGSRDSSLLVTKQGIYSVTVTNACGPFTDVVTVYVDHKPTSELPRDTLLCGGTLWDIELSNLYTGYEWQDGSGAVEYQVSEPGLYLLKKSNTCGKRVDSMQVEYKEPPTVNLGPDTLVCESIAPLILDASTSGNVHYEWDNGSKEPSMVALEAGRYAVTVTDQETGCSTIDHIGVSECPAVIWIPSAFTPNTDGTNEVFLPVVSFVSDYELNIFNRWGEQIFGTIDPNVGWDGSYKGEMVPLGQYVYQLNFSSDQLGFQSIRGSVALIR